jgi:nitroreductase
MLAATALGLGSCCIGSAVPVLNTPAIKQELSIPADVDVVVPLVVGASRETVNPVSRREPQVLSWQ